MLYIVCGFTGPLRPRGERGDQTQTPSEPLGQLDFFAVAVVAQSHLSRPPLALLVTWQFPASPIQLLHSSYLKKEM